MPNHITPSTKAMVGHCKSQKLAYELQPKKGARPELLLGKRLRVTEGGHKFIEHSMVIEGVKARIAITSLQRGDVHNELQQFSTILCSQESPQVHGVVVR